MGGGVVLAEPILQRAPYFHVVLGEPPGALLTPGLMGLRRIVDMSGGGEFVPEGGTT